jgi:hypothetical protein
MSDPITGWGIEMILTALYRLLWRYFDKRVIQKRKWKNSHEIEDSITDFWLPVRRNIIHPGDLVRLHETALCEYVPITSASGWRTNIVTHTDPQGDREILDATFDWSKLDFEMHSLARLAVARLLPKQGIRAISACLKQDYGDQDGFRFSTENAIPTIIPDRLYTSRLAKQIRSTGCAICDINAQVIDLPMEIFDQMRPSLPRKIWPLIPRQVLCLQEDSQLISVGPNDVLGSYAWTLAGSSESPSFYQVLVNLSDEQYFWPSMERGILMLKRTCKDEGKIILTDFDEITPRFQSAHIVPSLP